MKGSILVALLLTLSTQVFGGVIQQEARRPVILRMFFGIQGNQTTIAEDSKCAENLRLEKAYALEGEAKTADDKANRVINKAWWITCLYQSVFAGVHWVDEKTERNYCDKDWIAKEVNTAKENIKQISSPASGRWKDFDPANMNAILDQALANQTRNCEIYVGRNGKPKPALAEKENVPVNANDTSRANIKEKEYSDTTKKSESINAQK